MIQLALGIIELLLLTFDYTVPVDKNVLFFLQARTCSRVAVWY